MSQTTAFAAATQPITSDTRISTDSAGLRHGDITIESPLGAFPAYYAAPDQPGPHPVVLVVQEIFGVHEHIRDIARRLAKLGYLAIAPELYHRQGDVRGLEIAQIREIVFTVPDIQVLADLDASLDWALANGGDAERIAITGFCWGGRITWLYAAHQPRLKAAVAWYGKLRGFATDIQPRYPLDVIAELQAPVLALYGGADEGIPQPDLDLLQQQLTEAQSASQLQVYPGAPHAFHADYRPSYRAEAATDGWQRLREWFKQHGV
ncbi:carboxymethylenebutenolidase [Andreprevotia lacus DSM 23236]|jgi:carboxymethylenebutenolidase|uniref:Carboxymethylenebutenolidase n=1 Tax=Andreprevotia lacus DSM 23236 TaxID=1121001 RepID=A0A1W1X572_9NEIS|nr:dienelactone hydrolase family protein [Andreprevotia lacus]SMC18997.1 carboxymethylenebutenolidase [Andreprevotia lacus DSM 23236]